MLPKIQQEIKLYERASGAQVNVDKTKILSLSPQAYKEYAHQTGERIKILRISWDRNDGNVINKTCK